MEQQDTRHQNRRIFISFLGTGNYEACRYRYGNEDVAEQLPEVKFVQTATVLHCSSPENPLDACLIFCTDEAEEKHWADLRDEFIRNGLAEPTKVPIPSGQNEKELWEIFKIVSEQVPQDARIVFDVTHSFRSLPILMTILLNYLKELKNVELETCSYGAWEARKEKGGISIVPVFDLTPFFELNAWARAVSLFEKTGSATEISKLVSELARKNEKMRIVKDSIRKVSDFTDAVATCRGREIKEFGGNRIFPELDEKDFPSPPFKPVYEKLKNVVADYRSGELRNGWRAVQWCIEHNLTQQGYTLLQETTVSIFEEKWKDELCLIEKKRREAISSCLGWIANGGKWDPKKAGGLSENERDELLKKCPENFPKEFRTLRNMRNDINHAGVSKNSPKARALSARLRELFKNFKEFGEVAECA